MGIDAFVLGLIAVVGLWRVAYALQDVADAHETIGDEMIRLRGLAEEIDGDA